jgi:hypothetical protein
MSLGSVRAFQPARKGDAAESFLPVVVTTRADPTQAFALYGVVDVAALDVTTTKAGAGRDTWVGCSGAKAEVATVDKVTIEEAKIRVDQDGLPVSPRVSALKAKQSCAMRRGVVSMEEFSDIALI